MRIFFEMIESGEECPMTGTGNSMRPFIKNEDDILIMASLKGKPVREGDIILYQRENGQYVIHRLYKVCPNGTCWFIGDNQFHLEKNIKQAQLRARVKYIIKNGKPISCEKGPSRYYFTQRMNFRVLVGKLYDSVSLFN